MIHRTMQDNISSVTHDFGNQESIAKVRKNAVDQLNVQKIALDGEDVNLQKIRSMQEASNRQSIALGVTPAQNNQTLATEANEQNLQTLAFTKTVSNTQNIDADVYAAYGSGVGKDKIIDSRQVIPFDVQQANRQALPEAESLVAHTEAIPVDSLSDHMECLPPEVRVKNLFEDIGVLNRKLDDFELQNKKILEAAKQARLESRRKEAEAMAESMNRQAFAISAPFANVEPLEINALGENVQEEAIETYEAKRQKISASHQPAVLMWMSDVDNVPLVESLQSIPITMPSEAPALASCPNGRIKKNQRRGYAAHRNAVPLRVHMKATVTFVVLSCWASTIAATDVMHPHRVNGLLERAGVVQMTDGVMQTKGD